MFSCAKKPRVDYIKHMETVNPLSILANYTHSQRTNFKKKCLTNQDAAILIIGSMVIAKSGEVKKSMRAWRNNDITYQYLFNTSQFGGYGFVGKSIDSTYNEVHWEKYNGVFSYENFKHGTTKRSTYWFRTKLGYYTPTLLGWSRYIELVNRLST